MGDPKRVELKISLGADAVAKARKQLGLTDATATRADIWFCEHLQREGARTKFGLFDRNLIVRIRRKHDGDSDTTVKFRGPSLHLPPEWDDPALHDNYKIEGDWTGTSKQVSASLDATVTGAAIHASVPTAPPLDIALFSDAQRQFAMAVAGYADGWDTLRPLGPIHALRWQEKQRDDFDDEVGAEQWIAGDLRFLELSIRVKFDKAEQRQRAFIDWAKRTRLGVSAVGTTKTQAVLEHFALQ